MIKGVWKVKMDNKIYLKKVKFNSNKNFDFEKIEGEGAVIIDEENDKIHFLNSTALMLYDEIKEDTVSNIYDRYKNKIVQNFSNTNELDIKQSFEDFLVSLVESEIVVFIE